jgi:hypothetical protein
MRSERDRSGDDGKDSWPFDQAPNVAAVTSQSVIDGASILLVVHYSDDHSWALLDGAELHEDEARLVAMKTMLGYDPTLAGIADLPPGWVAKRDAVGSVWVSASDPEV